MPKKNIGPHLNFESDKGVWYVRWYECGRRRRRSTGTADREGASDFLAAHIAEESARKAIFGDGPSRPDQRRIASCLTAYLSDKAPDMLSIETATYAVDALLSFWGEKTISEISPETCKAYVKARNKAPATSRRELSTLRAAIGHDFAEKRLTAMVPVWLPPQPEHKDRWISRKEFASLLRASRKDPRGKHLPLFMLLAIYTAARKEGDSFASLAPGRS